MAKKEDQKGHTPQYPHNCNNMTMSLISPTTRLIVAAQYLGHLMIISSYRNVHRRIAIVGFGVAIRALCE